MPEIQGNNESVYCDYKVRIPLYAQCKCSCLYHLDFFFSGSSFDYQKCSNSGLFRRPLRSPFSDIGSDKEQFTNVANSVGSKAICRCYQSLLRHGRSLPIARQQRHRGYISKKVVLVCLISLESWSPYSFQNKLSNSISFLDCFMNVPLANAPGTKDKVWRSAIPVKSTSEKLKSNTLTSPR